MFGKCHVSFYNFFIIQWQQRVLLGGFPGFLNELVAKVLLLLQSSCGPGRCESGSTINDNMLQKTPRWGGAERPEDTAPRRPLVSPSRPSSTHTFSGLSENRYCCRSWSTHFRTTSPVFRINLIKLQEVI